jgi:hypothetical protein
MQVRDLQLKKVDVSGAKGPPDSDGGRQPKSTSSTFSESCRCEKGTGRFVWGRTRLEACPPESGSPQHESVGVTDKIANFLNPSGPKCGASLRRNPASETRGFLPIAAFH